MEHLFYQVKYDSLVRIIKRLYPYASLIKKFIIQQFFISKFKNISVHIVIVLNNVVVACEQY
jgi:hypothetical protein